MAYEAIVTKIHTRPHPNADKLLLGTCHGFQVVVGKDTQDGELGVFFPADGQLSNEMCRSNNLYSESACRKLGIIVDDGTPVGSNPSQNARYGFFSERRRVRAQSFRGQRSEGYWVPLADVRWTGLMDAPVEGFTFTSLNGYEVCQKYETPATRHQNAGKVGRKQRENICFPKHDVTRQFRFVGNTIPSDAVIYITEKLHGTSGRYGRVLDELDYTTLPWYMRFFRWLLRDTRELREYRYLNGSKNVILEKTTGAGYYGTNEFRYRAIENVNLHKGEVVYFEIVGDVITAGLTYRPIMSPQPIKAELKDVRKQYGDTMNYRYGLKPGDLDIYVYKIVRMNEDGVGLDLSWPQVKARCNELGLKHVPELSGPRSLKEFDFPEAGLAATVDLLTEGSSTLDSSHIREGVVLRVESTEGISYIKNKSWTFGVLEGYIKDDDTYVDTEEVA